MDIAVIGLGLIGGSLARTIKLHTDARVFGCDTDPETLRQAFALKAIDMELNDEKLRGCAMVLIALYPRATAEWLGAHRRNIAPDALVIDCCGVKETVMEAVTPIARAEKWHYIGGHPMAGREYSGFRYARDDLFDNASMVLTPMPEEELPVLQKARDFFMDLGFRRVQFTTPPIHDEIVAYTSQLPHILASAYVQTPMAARHKGFSANTFADMTRDARLNEDLWTELFLDNREPLLHELNGLTERLAAYRDALERGDADALRTLLRAGRERKESLEEA